MCVCVYTYLWDTVMINVVVKPDWVGIIGSYLDGVERWAR